VSDARAAAPATPPPLPTPPRIPLLAAEWRHLVLLSFEVDPRVLAPFVPAGTELDRFCGAAFASVVGFQFLNACLFGVRVPLHGNFEELNLRFYVRRPTPHGWRRGVVFLSEIVPKRTVVWVARAFGENFRRLPINHRIDIEPPAVVPRRIEYACQLAGQPQRLLLETAADRPAPPTPGSLDEFLIEHYWAYTALPRRRTREHYVVHPPWQIAPAAHAQFDANVRELYGRRFAPFLSRRPASAFWADGSAVSVHAAAGR
jgi:uncharacterized protein YqjF (DUF2071 family)